MLSELHERFLLERKYFRNVSPATTTFYQSCFKALPLNPDCYKADLLAGIERLKTRGVTPRSINDYIRGNKAFLNWCHQEQIVKEPIKLSWLKEESKIIQTLSADDISALIRYKAVGTNLLRAHVVALVILDCGLRIAETINLRKKDINLESLTLFVVGKGGKHRLVPISQELRKRLYLYMRENVHEYLFPTRSGGKVTVRNIERDFKSLFKRAGIEGIRCSPHTIRHTFAVCYLRNGGNLEFLRRYLGHTSLTTTQKYLKSLGVEDLGAVHNNFSPLSRR